MEVSKWGQASSDRLTDLCISSCVVPLLMSAFDMLQRPSPAQNIDDQ